MALLSALLAHARVEGFWLSKFGQTIQKALHCEGFFDCFVKEKFLAKHELSIFYAGGVMPDETVQQRLLAEGATARVHWRLNHKGGEAHESPRWRNYVNEFQPLGLLRHTIVVTLQHEAMPCAGNCSGLVLQLGVSFEDKGPVFPLSLGDVEFIYSHAIKPNGRRLREA